MGSTQGDGWNLCSEDGGSPGLFLGSVREALGRSVSIPAAGRICLFAEEPYSAPCLVISDMADGCAGTPIPTVTDLRVPGWVSAGTLAVLVSGRAGDALSAVYDTVASRGCAVCCVMPGCPLADRCVSDGNEHLPVPGDGDLASTYGCILGTLAAVVGGTGAMDAPEMLLDALGRSVPGDDAAGTARRLSDGYPAFYSTSDVRALCMGWRSIIGEALGRPCFSGELPEFDHNELVGWSDPNEHAPSIRMVVLRGRREGGLVPAIVGCMLEVLEESGRDVLTIDVGDGDAAGRDLYGLALAFSVSDAIAEAGR